VTAVERPPAPAPTTTTSAVRDWAGDGVATMWDLLCVAAQHCYVLDRT
jgi:hypothetical protein